MGLNLLLFRVLIFLVASSGGLLSEALAMGSSQGGLTNNVLQFRVLHLVLRGNSPAVARDLVDTAKRSGYNAIQFMLTDGVTMVKSPWVPKPNAWTKKQLIDWVAYIRKSGLEAIPEVKLLTHQDKLLAKKHPNLLFNAVTYDPRKEDVYSLIFPFIDEIIESFSPKIIHIGHDEVVGWNKAHALKKLHAGETPLPAHLFIKDVSRLHSYLRKRGVEVWMWGDMLLDPEEFPDMLAEHLHGSMPGYGKVLRDQLPRDIVICDWHYFDRQSNFASLARMQAEGFRVIAATWKREGTIRNFARHAREQHAYGLMATTWYNMDSPEHGPLVQWIALTSARLFQDPSAIDISAAPTSATLDE
jgi:hypothetical protein